MTYEQRMAVLNAWLRAELAPRFTMPRDLDPKVVATDVLEAINSHLPARLTEDQVRGFLSTILKDITRNAKSRTLPTTKEFIDATRGAVETLKAMAATPLADTPSIDPVALTAKRVRAREPIGDMWLRGSLRQLLMAKTGITNEDLAPYDLYIAANMQYDH